MYFGNTKAVIFGSRACYRERFTLFSLLVCMRLGLELMKYDYLLWRLASFIMYVPLVFSQKT